MATYQPVSQRAGSDSEDGEEMTLFAKDFGEGEYDERDELIFTAPAHKKQAPAGAVYLVSPRRVRVLICVIASIVGIVLSGMIAYSIYSLVHSAQPWTAPISTTTDTTAQPAATPVNLPPQTPRSSSWKMIEYGMTEMSPALLDVDQDGILDMIGTRITLDSKPESTPCFGNGSEKCHSMGLNHCRVALQVLSGRDGHKVSEMWTDMAVFAIKCPVDLTGDGVAECYVAGRQGALAAVDLRNRQLLWIVDNSITFAMNNYYYPLLVRDFDGDGVLDLINIHSGDGTYSDREKNRAPGMLVIVSGRTGQSLMEPIPVPDDRESYSSPMLFTLPDQHQSEVVLFGSGGETIQGSLWAVTLASLQEHVDQYLSRTDTENYEVNLFHISTDCYSSEEKADLHAHPKHTNGTFVQGKWEDWMSACPHWSEEILPAWNPFHICVYNLVSGGRDGTIIPQVSIDMTGDGRNDLIVTELSDRILLMDGASGDLVWTRVVPDTQTYRWVSVKRKKRAREGIDPFIFRAKEYNYVN